VEIFGFGPGQVRVGDDGSVEQVLHPDGRRVLLDAGTDAVHDSLHAWGKGFVITGSGGVSYRFDSPALMRWRQTGIDLLYQFGDLELRVGRRFGEQWTETYELRNTGAAAVEVGSLAVSTPYRDIYTSSRESLTGAVHAHIWTGGADAWVWATPMDGSGPGLGLRLTEGELWAYSVESREPGTGSNIRGHIFLHVTDRARAPHAMGGQPVITLAPGASYRWTWQLAWYDDLPTFHADREPLIDADRLAAEVGETIQLTGQREESSDAPGLKYVDATDGKRTARIAVLFHEPLRTIAERRVRFILDRQRRPELTDSRRYAFVPYDNDSRLTVHSGGWRDWSDARERVGMALLLQEVRAKGWGDRAELDEALAGYEQFVREQLLDDAGSVRDDSIHESAVRLYNFPWFARFLLGQGDREGATRILERYYELGGEHFLAFDLGPLLSELGMRDQLARHAAMFVEYGNELPPHEVNYEQSMVAPLLELLVSAYHLGQVDGAELTKRLPWLTAFAADQPDVRLRHVPIRHWDGYWFGRLRLWGDVFPHYWSALSAVVYAAWPRELVNTEQAAWLDASADAILRANLVNFATDGTATCAFVYPSCVNGQPAHVADPLANDQDWALVYALRLGLAEPRE
jgi:hypothetical protein